MDSKQVKAVLNKIKEGDEIAITGDLPRVVEVHQPKGVQGNDGYTPGFEGEVYELELNKPLIGTVVAVNVGPGKLVGVRLPEPPDGTRWYDAHSCDGATDDKYGWWIHPENFIEDNQHLMSEVEDES